jgi:uncharacterized protein
MSSAPKEHLLSPLVQEKNQRPTGNRRYFFLALEIVTIIGAVILYFSVVHQSQVQAKLELNDKLMVTLKGCRGEPGLETVRDLLRQGANANAANTGSNSLTALMVASSRGYPDLVKLLLDSGADVNAKGKVLIQGAGGFVLDGITPLWAAAFSGDVQVVRMLIDHGADLTALDSRGASVMFWARSNDVVQTFLDHGLDINARDMDGNTLLTVSVLAYADAKPNAFSARVPTSRMPDVGFLLLHGADPNVRNRDGLTPLRAAQGRALIALLNKAGAKE